MMGKLMNKDVKELIRKYTEAYNSFDIEGMLSLLHEDIEFRNISGGVTNAETKGIQEFRQIAEQSKRMFSSRQQTVKDLKVSDDIVEAGIDYEAVLAVDLPNGLKAGDALKLTGKSVFRVKENKISVIEDYS